MSFLKGTLEQEILNKHEAERLRGRLQFASHQQIQECLAGSEHTHLQRLQDSFGPTNRPRNVNSFEWMHDPNYHSGTGGLLLNDRGDSDSVSNEECEPSNEKTKRQSSSDSLQTLRQSSK